MAEALTINRTQTAVLNHGLPAEHRQQRGGQLSWPPGPRRSGAQRSAPGGPMIYVVVRMT